MPSFRRIIRSIPQPKYLTYVNVLAKVNKFPYVHLLNMTLHDAYSIIIHVSTMTVSYISHEQNE